MNGAHGVIFQDLINKRLEKIPVNYDTEEKFDHVLILEVLRLKGGSFYVKITT